MDLIHELRLFFDGEHYDRRVKFSEDIPFWLNQAKRYGAPILELGCGTGRVAIPLAKAGFSVTGIDLSDSMLSQAQKKAKSENVEVEWIIGDIRNFDLNKKFQLIIFPLNTICHLYTLEDLEGCLLCVKKHLKPNGRFITSTFNPRLDILMRDPSKHYPHAEYEGPDGKVVVTETNWYDRAKQINNIKLFYRYKDKEVIENLTMRIYFPQELDALLKYNGFEIEYKYGDYDESPFMSDSPWQLVVCKLQTHESP